MLALTDQLQRQVAFFRQITKSGIIMQLFIFVWIILQLERRMTDSIQKNKLITKLIKIISEKEKIIEKLKRSAKNQQKQLKGSQEISLPVFDQKLKEDITSTSIQVKAIQEKMQFMQEKIIELTQVLNEEISINTIYEEKNKKFEQNEQKYTAQIERLNKIIVKQQTDKASFLQRITILQIENLKLIQKIEEFKVQIQYQKILQAKISQLMKANLQNEKFEQKISQSIECLYSRFCLNPQKRSTRQLRPSKQVVRRQDLCIKLEQLDMTLKEAFTLHDGDVLNETLDGLSIIMKSFEEKLEGVVCLTDRNSSPEANLSQKNANGLTQPSKNDNSQEKLLLFDKQQKEENHGCILSRE